MDSSNYGIEILEEMNLFEALNTRRQATDAQRITDLL